MEEEEKEKEVSKEGNQEDLLHEIAQPQMKNFGSIVVRETNWVLSRNVIDFEAS